MMNSWLLSTLNSLRYVSLTSAYTYYKNMQSDSRYYLHTSQQLLELRGY